MMHQDPVWPLVVMLALCLPGQAVCFRLIDGIWPWQRKSQNGIGEDD